MAQTVKTSKMIMMLIGSALLNIALAYGSDINVAGLPVPAKEIKMSDAIVFPHPEKPTAAIDPFFPLSTATETASDEQSGQEEEFSISSLKLKGIIIMGDQVCALIEKDGDIKKYVKGDNIMGYGITDITTKGVEFEKDGKETVLQNTAR